MVLRFGDAVRTHGGLDSHQMAICRTQPPEHSAVARPVVGPQEIGAELIEARAADLAHYQIDLVDEDIDRLLDPGEPAGRGGIEGRAYEEAEIGAEPQRDQDVGAAPH